MRPKTKSNEVKAWCAKLGDNLLADYVLKNKFQVRWELDTYFGDWKIKKVKIVSVIVKEVKPCKK
jgi:hypothetical protein